MTLNLKGEVEGELIVRTWIVQLYEEGLQMNNLANSSDPKGKNPEE